MTTYKTGNQLGSSAAKDLYDNAQNLDFALNSINQAIWSDRFGRSRRSYWGMEQAFSAQILNQEQRFNKFIQYSGYQTIGDYENGPLTIREYNQLIRYDNELWKITAATDIPYTTSGIDSTSWASDSIHFVSVGDAALRQELSTPLGPSRIGYRFSDLYSVISRIMTQSDVGATRPYLGRDLVADQAIWDAQIDCNLMHRGSIFTAKKTRGIRQHATVLSIRANSENNGAFVPQVAGSDDVGVISLTGELSSVALFTDNWATDYEAWESIDTAIYTANSFTTTNTAMLDKLLIGDLIKTKHSSPFIGIVTGINENLVSVQKWVIWGTTTIGTPADGTGLYLNPIDKIWGQNTNISFGPNTRANRGAAVEYGVLNKGVEFFNNITGVDSVILPESTYGAGSAFRARSSNVPARWQNCYEGGGGNLHNVYMHDSGGLPSSNASYREGTTSAIGFKFDGKNITYSLAFYDSVTGLETATFTPWGHQGRGGKLTSSLTNGQSPSAARRYLVSNAAPLSIVLPDPTNRKYGEDYEFVFTGTATVTFTAATGSVNGQASVIIVPSAFTSRTAMVGGSALWYLYA